MRSADPREDRLLLEEISRITSDYGALHRRTARDLARARSELAKAHETLGAVAHDLRAPLAAVSGFTELLLDDEELTPAQRELGERIGRAARVMTALTEELVDVITAGSAPLQSEPVDLVTVVGHVVSRHQLLGSSRGVQVAFADQASAGGPVVVHGDEAKLDRLLDNLISNAVKFSPDGGRVRVALASVAPATAPASGPTDSATVEVRVSDEGPGIAPAQIEQVFAPFHRAPGAEDVPGIGLGLAIVKRIAERHGGRVHVESVVGDGATFVVGLPLVPPS